MKECEIGNCTWLAEYTIDDKRVCNSHASFIWYIKYEIEEGFMRDDDDDR